MSNLIESETISAAVHYLVTGFLMVTMFVLAVASLVMLVVAINSAINDYIESRTHKGHRTPSVVF